MILGVRSITSIFIGAGGATDGTYISLGPDESTTPWEISFERGLHLILLSAWIVLLMAFPTRKLYELMIKSDLEKHAAVYYDGRLIHILASGLAALLIPLILQ